MISIGLFDRTTRDDPATDQGEYGGSFCHGCGRSAPIELSAGEDGSALRFCALCAKRASALLQTAAHVASFK